ncbi:hypothetical protein GQ42DRAFT_17360 [Ramicandelaber brevisporus]|nr:hypothetical protein GQ42DRAFT_17360 [Ramicandelaber brevisporus]
MTSLKAASLQLRHLRLYSTRRVASRADTPAAASGSRFSRRVLPSSSQGSPFVQISGLPLTTTRNDILHFTKSNGVGASAVKNVFFDYNQQLKPMGRCVVELQNPKLADNMVKMSRFPSKLGGQKAHVTTAVYGFTVSQTSQAGQRSDGSDKLNKRGSLSAADYTHPAIGTEAGSGCSVVLAGLPGFVSIEEIRTFLSDYDMADLERPVIEILPRPFGDKTNHANAIVRLSTVSEAYRLVRREHAQFYRTERHGNTYRISARVVE